MSNNISSEEGPATKKAALKVILLFLVLSLGIVSIPLIEAAGPAGNTESEGSVQRARLTADVATRRPLRKIIRRAVADGMGIERVVATLIEAGSDSQAVAYTAILEGYSACEVVKGALEAHADRRLVASAAIEAQGYKGASEALAYLQLVVSAAIAAGADSALICTCAVEAGLSPEVCADAVASASAPGAPVYGYSDSASEAGIYSPGTSVVYGGGGGTTRKASPHKP